MSYVDIGIIALLLLFAALGVWKGLQKTSLALGAFLISFIISFFLANVVAEAFLGIDGVRQFVLGKDGVSLFTWVRDSKGDMPGSFIFKNFYEPIYNTIPKKLLTASFTAADAAAVSVAFSIFSAIVGVGLFIVIRALLCIVTMIVKSYIPRKKSMGNRVAGLAVGAVRGGVWALVFTIVFSVLGGLPAMSKMEKEFDDSAMAHYLNTAAYSIKNALFIPDDEMLERLIQKGGFIEKEEKPEKPELPDPLKVKRYELYAEIMNLNYPTGHRYEVDTTTGEIKENADGWIEVDTSVFERTGFKDAYDAILAYNVRLADNIKADDGALKDATQETLEEYDTVRSNILRIMSGGGDNFIVSLTNYNNILNDDSFGNSSEAGVVENTNNSLRDYYNKIVAALDALKVEYAKYELLTVPAAAGEFTLPDYPALIQDEVQSAPLPEPDPASVIEQLVFAMPQKRMALV